MYETLTAGNQWMVKNTEGEIFNVAYWRIFNGFAFEAIIFKSGAFTVCPKEWEIIDNEALAAKARVLFAAHFPEFEAQQTANA